MKVKSKAKAPEAVETGSGNAFTDLLATEGLTQAAAARRLGIGQPHVSELKNYKLGPLFEREAHALHDPA